MPFAIHHLSISVEGKSIVRDVTLDINPGEVHVLMGPNGSGKSTLAQTIMGHPSYQVSSGTIHVDGVDVTDLAPHERARKGLFLSFQYPSEISGVSVQQFVRRAYVAIHGPEADLTEFQKRLTAECALLGIDPSFATRSLNEGFSGGEKKRMEMLQLSILRPKYALLDETDSGLDIDAIKAVGHAIAQAQKNGTGILIITHYARLLRHLKADRVHIIRKGKLIRSGGPELADEIEDTGYESAPA